MHQSTGQYQYFPATNLTALILDQMGAKVPAVVRLAKEALANDCCVVIGLQSTGEARIDDFVDTHGFQGEFLSPAGLFLSQ